MSVTNSTLISTSRPSRKCTLKASLRVESGRQSSADAAKKRDGCVEESRGITWSFLISFSNVRHSAPALFLVLLGRRLLACASLCHRVRARKGGECSRHIRRNFEMRPKVSETQVCYRADGRRMFSISFSIACVLKTRRARNYVGNAAVKC